MSKLHFDVGRVRSDGTEIGTRRGNSKGEAHKSKWDLGPPACRTHAKKLPVPAAGKVPDKPVIDLKHFWQWMRVRADIPDVRIHDLRHTFASLLGVRRGLAGNDRAAAGSYPDRNDAALRPLDRLTVAGRGERCGRDAEAAFEGGGWTRLSGPEWSGSYFNVGDLLHNGPN